MPEELFDLSEEYQQMLDQGISLSGESMFFFIEGRLNALRAHLPSQKKILNILDFGCGIGHSTSRLAELFPGASVTGADTSTNALEMAATRNGSESIRYITIDRLSQDDRQYDLCYVNGVFHHIPLNDRATAIRLIFDRMAPQGLLYLFENNPWNPGARLVMSRIPFDRDAVMLSPLETAALMTAGGFQIAQTGSLFFFPRALSFLRAAEPYLAWSRLGAQYYVAGIKR